MHEQRVGASTAGHFQVFEYPDVPLGAAAGEWQGWDEPQAAEKNSSAASEADAARTAAEARMRAELERRLAEETRKAFEAGREKGRQEGRAAEHEAHAVTAASAGAERARHAAQLMESFVAARDQYLARVEREVVELALAVATRILRREAQMDPLLLTGAVRVALGQLSGTTEVRLRVPAGDLALWTEAMALVPNLALKPAVVPGEGMRLGECVIETSLGSVDLGIRAQLGEIERGFFDRMGGPRAESPAAVIEGAAGENQGARP